jgi:hypothetical protein
MVKMVFPTPTIVPQGIGSPCNTKGTSSKGDQGLDNRNGQLASYLQPKRGNFGDRVDGNYEDG